MNFLIADGRKRGDDHIKAIEPRPAFDVMKSRHADERQHTQRDCDEFKVAEDFHEELSALSFQPSAYPFASKGGRKSRVARARAPVPPNAKFVTWGRGRPRPCRLRADSRWLIQSAMVGIGLGVGAGEAFRACTLLCLRP